MNSTDYLKGYGVTPRLKSDGKIGLRGMGSLSEQVKAEVIAWAKDNREAIFQELNSNVFNVFTQKGGDTGGQHPRIEPMNTCLHGSKCRYLNGPGECRPVCSKAGIPVFDLKGCPLNLWGGSQESVEEIPLASSWRKIPFVNQSMVAMWRRGKQWCLEHLAELYALGWDRHELLRAGRLKYPMGSWGPAWFWPEGEFAVSLESDGVIRWTWRDANGKDVAHTMRPQKPIERKDHEKNEL